MHATIHRNLSCTIKCNTYYLARVTGIPSIIHLYLNNNIINIVYQVARAHDLFFYYTFVLDVCGAVEVISVQAVTIDVTFYYICVLSNRCLEEEVLVWVHLFIRSKWNDFLQKVLTTFWQYVVITEWGDAGTLLGFIAFYWELKICKRMRKPP